MQQQRRCGHCKTMLSQYNAGSACFRHQNPRLERLQTKGVIPNSGGARLPLAQPTLGRRHSLLLHEERF